MRGLARARRPWTAMTATIGLPCTASGRNGAGGAVMRSASVVTSFGQLAHPVAVEAQHLFGAVAREEDRASQQHRADRSGPRLQLQLSTRRRARASPVAATPVRPSGWTAPGAAHRRAGSRTARPRPRRPPSLGKDFARHLLEIEHLLIVDSRRELPSRRPRSPRLHQPGLRAYPSTPR